LQKQRRVQGEGMIGGPRMVAPMGEGDSGTSQCERGQDARLVWWRSPLRR
jgi:hypothetical protein